MTEIIALSLLAGIVAVDITAFGQIMISRPIFCGPLFGFFLNDIAAGLWIGAILELVWINAIPMGTFIPQDITTVCILSCVWGIGFLGSDNGGIVFAMALAVPVGLLFKYFDVRLRYFNSKIVRWIESGIEAGKESRISSGIYLGIFLFFFKAFLFYLVFIALGKLFMVNAFGYIPAQLKSGLGVAWYVLPLVGLAVVFVNACREKFGHLKKGIDS